MLWGEIRGKWKSRQRPGVEPRTPLAWVASALPLSHDSRMTTNPHYPLCVLISPHNIQIHLFPAWGKMLSARRIKLNQLQWSQTLTRSFCAAILNVVLALGLYSPICVCDNFSTSDNSLTFDKSADTSVLVYSPNEIRPRINSIIQF